MSSSEWQVQMSSALHWCRVRHVVEVEHKPDFECVELSHKTQSQTLIVGAVDELVDHPDGHGVN